MLKSEAELIQPATGIEPRQQVYTFAQELKRKGRIASRRDGLEWVFFIGDAKDYTLVNGQNLPPSVLCNSLRHLR